MATSHDEDDNDVGIPSFQVPLLYNDDIEQQQQSHHQNHYHYSPIPPTTDTITTTTPTPTTFSPPSHTTISSSSSWRLKLLSFSVVFALLCVSSFVPFATNTNTTYPKTKPNNNIWSFWSFFGSFNNNVNVLSTICLHRFHPSEHLGIRSPYMKSNKIEDIRGNGNAGEENEDSKGRLLHVSVVARGGERNLGENVARGLDRLEKWIRRRNWARRGNKGKGIEWLVGWRNEWKIEESGRLSERGRRVVEGLGKRCRRIYGDRIWVQNGKVVSGGDLWVKESAMAFAKGWNDQGGTKSGMKVDVLTRGKDNVVRFVRNCKAYAKFERREGVKGLKEVKRMEKELMKLGEKAALRLGVNENELSESIVRSIYDACTLQVSQKLVEDQFCSLLPPKYLLLRETLDEMKTPLLRTQERLPSISAPLARDVISSMDTCIANSSSCAPVLVRLGDVETLVPFLSLLNVYKTEKKVRMTKIHTTRRFLALAKAGQVKGASTCRSRLSTMAPFAGNLIMELYAPSKKTPEPVVRFRLHEQYIERIMACGGKNFCTLYQLKDYLEPVLTADWDYECAGHGLGY